MNFKLVNDYYRESYTGITPDMVDADVSDKQLLEIALNNSISTLRLVGETDLSKYCSVMEQAICDVYPDKEWYDITSINIKEDLWNTQSPEATVTNILNSIPDLEMQPATDSFDEKSIEESAANEGVAVNDRLRMLLKIVDDAFEGKDTILESELTEALRLTSIPGVTRDSSNDFSDDGNRFSAYLYKGVVPITYLKADGQIYITIAFHHLGDINYREYSKFDSYAAAEDFNGVSENAFNAAKFEKNLEAAYKDIMNFRNEVTDVDEAEIDARVQEINQACASYKERVKEYLKSKTYEIMELSPARFSELQRYVKSAGNRTADYIKEASQSSKREFLAKDLAEIKKNISNEWNFKYIRELLGDKTESYYKRSRSVKERLELVKNEIIPFEAYVGDAESGHMYDSIEAVLEVVKARLHNGDKHIVIDIPEDQTSR